MVISMRPAFTTPVLVALLAVSAFSADSPDPERVRSFRRYALESTGDASRGKELFLTNSRLVCTNCHNITGKEKSGPNLEGIGDKFTREQLIDAILYPSRSIKPGFEQVTIVTKDGRTHAGRVERINKAVHRIIDAKGRQKDIPSGDVESLKVSDVSMMPDNLVASVSREQFADLIAWLKTLSFGVHSGFTAGAKEIEIPRLQKPVELRRIHPADEPFANPVWIGALPGNLDDMIVIEHHTSRLIRLSGRGSDQQRSVFLDLSGETYLSNNQGLTCLAFHPDYKTNGRYFLNHETEEDGKVRTVVVERKATADGRRDSGEPSRRLLQLDQPAFNHNGGCIAFGPDGMLYVGFGDGGPQRDPPGFSQDKSIFHGAILRIDVDHREEGLEYAVPKDNPFVAAAKQNPTIRPEIWAFGFREPWRFSFDPADGRLFVGDVGQDTWEEVSIVRRGGNYGWNVREGFAPFSEEYRRSGEQYLDPVFAYEHGLGFSVTGGHVYRGSRSKSFQGVYVFGDYNTRRVWGMRLREGAVESVAEIATAPAGIASFGLDRQGEIYLVMYRGEICHVDLATSEFETLR